MPVELVVDHSVQVDYWSTPDALRLNMEVEFQRNRARYEFLKWGMQAFHGFDVVPPGIGIVHQVNLEYLAQGVVERDGVYFPGHARRDRLPHDHDQRPRASSAGASVGSRRRPGMLGQPVYFLTPDVVGVHMTGRLPEGATATDLVLAVTEMLRKAKVVGKFVEFHGEGAASLAVTDRATMANMAPEYGATMGFFPVDEETCRVSDRDGRVRGARRRRSAATTRRRECSACRVGGECDYSRGSRARPRRAFGRASPGPRRPQDRIDLPESEDGRSATLLEKPVGGRTATARTPESLGRKHATRIGVQTVSAERPLTGGGQPGAASLSAAGRQRHESAGPRSRWSTTGRRRTAWRSSTAESLPPASVELGHGDVLIAAITSCTNTSNPSVMLAAGAAREEGGRARATVPPYVKASLAPGSRVVTDYLDRAGLQPYLDQLGFNLVGYGCTTCIGNSGPLDPRHRGGRHGNDLVAACRPLGQPELRGADPPEHQGELPDEPAARRGVRAGRTRGHRPDDRADRHTAETASDVFLRDIWPSSAEVEARAADPPSTPTTYRRLYADLAEENPLWNEIPSADRERSTRGTRTPPTSRSRPSSTSSA